MTCEELTGFLDEYLEGTLAGETRAVFERHLGVCRDCRNYLESYRRSVGAVKGVGKVEGEVPEGLVRAILAARGTQKDEG